MKNNTQQKPKLYLIDGNAFDMIGKGMRALRRTGATQDEIKRFEVEASSGTYDHLIQTLQKWFDIQLGIQK